MEKMPVYNILHRHGAMLEEASLAAVNR